MNVHACLLIFDELLMNVLRVLERSSRVLHHFVLGDFVLIASLLVIVFVFDPCVHACAFVKVFALFSYSALHCLASD